MTTRLRSALRGLLRHPFLAVPFAFYLYTCSPSIGLGDTALLVEGIHDFKINTHVNNHNFTVLLGRLLFHLPVGDLAYRANLASVVAGSVTIALYYLLMLFLFESRLTAALAASALMVSHSMWWHSTISEVYAINALFTVLALHLFARLQRADDRDRTLVALCFISALAIFNHIQMGSLVVGSAAAVVWTLIRRRPAGSWPGLKLLACCAAAYAIGLLPYGLTFLKDVRVNHSVAQTLSLATGGQFRQLMFKGSWTWALREVGYLIVHQFPSPFLLAVVAGVLLLIRRWGASASVIGIATTFAINTGFFMFYNTWDRFAFLLPSFVILAFCGAFAIDALVSTLRRGPAVLQAGGVALAAASILVPVWFYPQLSRWGDNPRSRWYARYNNNYTRNTHNVSEFLANPNKRRYHDVEEFARLIFEKLPRGATLFDDDSRTYYPLAAYYQRYYNKRPDVSIEMVNSWHFSNWGDTPEGFGQRVRDAYERDEPFFLISIQYPFSDFLSKIQDAQRYRFERFALDERRWIYRLVTSREAGTASASSGPGAWDVLDPSRPIRLNVTDRNVLFSREGSTLMQPMATFGGEWDEDDQLFFGALERGAEIGLLLRMSMPMLAQVRLVWTAAPDFGLVEVYLNNRTLTAEPVNLYAERVMTISLDLMDVPLEQGNNILAFRIVGKDGRSDGLKMGLDTVEIIPLASVAPPASQ